MRIKQRQLPETLPDLPTVHPLLQRIYAVRGVQNSIELDVNLPALLPFSLLTDIEKACERLEYALRHKEAILIVGDFDADGATSTTLAVLALRAMGAASVDFLVPNRFEFGYGLTPAIVEVAKTRHPKLIITVDNGIASLDGVETANAAGIDVLVTDHHLPAETLPKAVAIVNPNQVGDCFPSKSIAGVGVIFYVMLALRRHLMTVGWFEAQKLTPPNMAQFLDLVALGTVADVVGLDQNNRIMVNQGLMRIRQGACRPGIQALIAIAGRDQSRLRETDLGFALAPRLNAAGRLEDMALGIECLLSDRFEHAHELGLRLNQLNQERRQIENEMKSQALLFIKESLMDMEKIDTLPVALCLFDAGWHQGVIGILAGRLKEKYYRPTIAFAAVGGDELKGSARSIPGLNIRDILASVDKDHPGLIMKFGGHAMAAGLSIRPQNFADFQTAFVAEVAKHLDATQCNGEIWTDGPLAAEEMKLETAGLLEQAGPWGQQFPEPCFNNTFDLLDQRIVGQNHLKLTLMHPEGEIFDAIAFYINNNEWPNYRARKVHAAYKLNVNEFRGKRQLQLLIEALEVVHSQEVCEETV